MSKVLLALHALLVVTPFLPVFVYEADLFHPRRLRSPAQEAWQVAREQAASRSIVAAAAPGLFALLNLPFVGTRRLRWGAWSSAGIGLCSVTGMTGLLVHYWRNGHPGAWVIWGLSLALLVAGTAAFARLGGRPCERCGHAS